MQLLWEALINMFDFDHSAARGKMASRALFVFKHDSVYGNCPAYKLFEAITVKKKDEVIVPRSFHNYIITVNEKEIPQGVTLERWL
jgi:CRISPR-associated protein Csd2